MTIASTRHIRIKEDIIIRINMLSQLFSPDNFVILGLISFISCLLLFRLFSACSELERISATLRELRNIAANDSNLKRTISSKHIAFIDEWRRGMKRGGVMCSCCRKDGEGLE